MNIFYKNNLNDLNYLSNSELKYGPNNFIN